MGVGDAIKKDLEHELIRLRKPSPEKLHLDPHELIGKLSFCKNLAPEEYDKIIELLSEQTVRMGEIIIKEGDIGNSLYFILRGVVRVLKMIEGKEIESATLMAGDFFGEVAVLYDVRRIATCKAVTPCILYRLERKDLEKVRSTCPSIQKAFQEAALKRSRGMPLNKPVR